MMLIATSIGWTPIQFWLHTTSDLFLAVDGYMLRHGHGASRVPGSRAPTRDQLAELMERFPDVPAQGQA